MNDETRGTAVAIAHPTPPALLPGETSSVAVAAKAKALVEARYLMALHRPRDWDVCRQKMLTECRRPGFANNKSAYYVKPIGQGVRGLGIRFAEMAVRCMTNISVEISTSYEDGEKRILAVCVTDLEANTPYEQAVTVSKTVERSKVPDGVTAISKRLNSYGSWTYLVPATDDDLLSKQGALVSKAMRELVLRCVPGDLKDECEQLILATRKDQAAKDPAATRKALADAFAQLGVTAQMLIEYLGHPLDQTTPDELELLRGLYGAIDDEETTWTAVMENRRQQRAQRGQPEGAQPAAAPKSEAPPPAATGSQRLKDKLAPAPAAAPSKAPQQQAEHAPPPAAATPPAQEAPAKARKPAAQPKPAAAGPSLPTLDAADADWIASLVATPAGEPRVAFVAAAKVALADRPELVDALTDKLDDLAFGG